MSNKRVLLDSDAIFGWMVEVDAHHQKAVLGFQRIKQERIQPLVTNLVIAEAATVFSGRTGQVEAHQFLRFIAQVETIFITPDLHQQTVSLFEGQARNHTSFNDMANVVVMREFEIEYLFSFDVTYKKHFQLPMLTPM